MIVIMDPAKREAQIVTPEMLPACDIAGCTTLSVAGAFTWAGKMVDWDSLTIVDDLPAARAKAWIAIRVKRDALAAFGAAPISDLVAHASALRAMTEAADTLAAIEAVDIDAGWPA
jgi:hypothetical protein